MQKLQNLADRKTYHSLIGWIPSVLIYFISLKIFDPDLDFSLPYSFVLTSFFLLLFSKISDRKVFEFTPRSFAIELFKFAALLFLGIIFQNKLEGTYLLTLVLVALSILAIYIFRKEVDIK
jgi:hypothetical protein